MRRRSTLLAVLLLAPLLVLAATRVARADADQAFVRGNEAYLHGDYAQAIQAYEQVASFGVGSVDLFFNLGNAYFRAGDLGRAIYNYERALELHPGDEDTVYNLQAARAAADRIASDRIEGADREPLLERLVAPFSMAWLTWAFLALYFAVFGVLVWLRYLAPGLLRSGIKTGAVFLSLVAVLSGVLLADKIYLQERVPRGIVLDRVVDAKEGADASYRTTFAVHAGLRVHVVGHDQDWLKVRLANGLEGWVPEAAIGQL